MSHFKFINILINCAGIGYPSKIIEKNKNKIDFIENFTETINNNLLGTVYTTKIVSEMMLKNKPNKNGERGVIINTSSIAAFEGQIGQAAYSASKAAIIGMMLPITRELSQYGIRIVTISPGIFNTPMFNKLSNKVKKHLKSKIVFPKKIANPFYYAKLVKHIIENPILNGENIRLDSALRM